MEKTVIYDDLVIFENGSLKIYYYRWNYTLVVEENGKKIADIYGFKNLEDIKNILNKFLKYA